MYKKLFAIKKEIGTLVKDKENPFFKNSKYVDINSLLKIVNPILEKHNVLLIQPPNFIGENKENVRPTMDTTFVNLDDNKQVWLTFTTIMPDIQDPQKFAAAVTYFRRISLISILGLPAEDDDGETAVGGGNAQKQNTNSQQNRYESYDIPPDRYRR